MTQAIEVGNSWKFEELGLDRGAATDQAVFAFARHAEARIVRWIQFPQGVLLFLMVPGDPESGWFCILDRVTGTFYSLDFADDGRWGGYREDEFEQLAHAAGLRNLAERPQLLPSHYCSAARPSSAERRRALRVDDIEVTLDVCYGKFASERPSA